MLTLLFKCEVCGIWTRELVQELCNTYRPTQQTGLDGLCELQGYRPDLAQYQNRLQVCKETPNLPRRCTFADDRSMQPMTWPDRVTVYHKLRTAPKSTDDSFILDVMILSEVRQRPAARCLEDVVTYDYGEGRKTALPPFMLEAFQSTFELQERAKAENSKKISNLLEKVQALEKDSWDRPDAKEDFGPPS